MTIVEKINSIPKLFHATGCSEHQIIEAQNALDLVFPNEFVEYVKTFGVISFFRTEWTGLNVDGHLNVLTVTKQERSLNPSFPKGYFVLENHAIEGIFTVVNESGHVYLLQQDRIEFLCCSLADYLDICIARK